MTTPEAWTKVKLSQIADIGWGDLSVTKKSYVESGYTAFSATGADGYLPYFDYDQDGIVVSAIGANCGKIWRAYGKWSCIKNTMRIIIKDAPVSLDYLYYFLSDPKVFPKRGSGQPFISKEDARDIEIAYPAIGEQHKIVELLEEHLSRLDVALADVKQAKVKAAQFRRSLLKSTFEEFIDNSVRIGDVVTFNRKKPVVFKNSELEVSFVSMPKVSEVSGQILLDESISHSEGQRRSLTYFENGDVIFAKITPCMENGKIALAKNLLNGAAYGSTEFHVLTPMESILPDFLRYFIGSDDFRADAERAMTGAVGHRRVPKTYLEGHAIPLPSINIQAEIVANLDEKLSRTDEAVKVAEKIEKESARLRRSLLQAAFVGQLTKEVVSV